MSAQVDEDLSTKLRECTPLEFSIHLEEIIESVIGVYKAGNQNDAAALAIDVCAAVDACASDSDAALSFQPWYTEYLKLCLHFGFYDRADRLTRKPWTTVGEQVSASSFMHFNFFAAITRIHGRDFHGAVPFLLLILSLEGTNIAMIQIAAMRKLILIQLLCYGQVKPLPVYVSKRCPLIFRLWENVRSGMPDHQKAVEYRSRSHDRRGDSNSIEAMEDIYPNILLPSKLRGLVSAFNDGPNLSISIISELASLESHLVKSRDWGIAKLLLIAKRRLILKKMSNIYYSVPVSKACAVSGCSSARELIEVCHSSLLGRDEVLGMVCLDREEEFLVFNRSQCAPRLSNIIEELHELKKRYSSYLEPDIA